MKNKLIYPLYAIVLIFLLCIAKLAISKENSETSFPGTRWLETDNFIGASRNTGSEPLNNVEIEQINFSENISLPELPILPDIPLTEEDK